MDILKRAMVEALKSTYGRVARACEIAGIARSTHYLWMSNDEEYKAAVEGVNEAAIDHVESKLFEKIDGVQIQRGVTDEGEPIIYDVPPSDTAIIFYLKCKAKSRGYGESLDINLPQKISIGYTKDED